MKKELSDININGIAYDSRKVQAGDIFVAIPGGKTDGADFIPQAIENGAKTIVTEKAVHVPDNIDMVFVPNARQALAELSARFYDYPAKKLKLIGITGTNGKTTIAYLVESILKEAGFKVGLLGTVETRIAGKSVPSSLTTPGALELQGTLAQMVKQGVTHVVMEVSSHALDQYRVHSLEFDIAVFTNLTHEHLDYHKTMEQYLESKQRLFRMLKPHGVAVVNVDDPFSKKIAEVVEGEVVFYGVKEGKHELRSTKYNEFDATLKDFEIRSDWMKVIIDSTEIRTPLIGLYNVYNILAAYQCGIILNVDRRKIKEGIEEAYVPGRFEKIECGQKFTVIVDFAHTPDALEQVLKVAQTFRSAHGRLILVFGCPGDRDREKRPIMGKIAKDNADLVIVTTDDPHGEDPEKIILEIEHGTRNTEHGAQVEKIIDRKAAIEKALKSAKKGDVVLIAGRGHEKFQDFNGQKVAIDDREVVKHFLIL